MTANNSRMVVNIHPITGDGALGEQASCLLQRQEQAGCLLSQCLERLKATGQNGFSTRDGTGRTKAGPGATTRRVVAPKAGLVGHGSGASDRSVGKRIRDAALYTIIHPFTFAA